MPQPNASVSRCGVCRRPLYNPFSVTVGVGPTCAKKVRKELARRMDEARQAGDTDRLQQLTEILRDFRFATTPNELQMAVLNDVRNANSINRRNNRRPSATPVVVQVESLTRGRQNERVRVEWINHNTAYTYSESGNRYETTPHACSCPDMIYRRGSYNEQGENVGRNGGYCRHMLALQSAQQEVANRRRTAIQNRRLQGDDVTELPVHTDVHLRHPDQTRRGRYNGEDNRADIESQIDTDNREVFLQNDYNTHIAQTEGRLPLDYVDYVSNDEAWNQVVQESYAEMPIDLEQPMFHSSETWGVEIEAHFPSERKKQDCLDELYREGIIYRNDVMHYHSTAPAGYFRAERDGSISGTHPSFEFVTPKLRDTKEDKERFLKATKILEKHGAFQSKQTGTHLTLDQKGLSEDPWAMQRFGRTCLQNEAIIAQVASGDMPKYKAYAIPRTPNERTKLEALKQQDAQQGKVRDDTQRMAEIRGENISKAQGVFRHGTYTQPFSQNLSFGGNISIDSMRRQISPSRYSMVSFRDHGGLEFRVNQGVNGEEIMRKARFYDALKAIGRDVRNESQGAEYSARFGEKEKHIRINGVNSTNPEFKEARLRELCSLIRDKNVVKDVLRMVRMGRV